MRTYLATASLTILAALMPPSVHAQTTHFVDVGPGFAFTPADIVIRVGDTVEWTWQGGFHNVESGTGGIHDELFRSGEPTSVTGTVYAFTFDQAFVNENPVPDNVYNYFCVVHVGLGMTGSVTVITCNGDLDGDDAVGLSDLAILLANYNSTNSGYFDGDLDTDGDVDLSDLAILLSVYGTTCG